MKTSSTTIHVESSIIGALIYYPDLMDQAAKILIPPRQVVGYKMFQHHHEIWDWMLNQTTRFASWDERLIASKFGNVSELIASAEPETFSSACAYLREDYEKRVQVKLYTDALQLLDTDSPYDVSNHVLGHLSDETPELAERTRGDEIRDAFFSIESGDIGVPTISKDLNDYTGGAQKGTTFILAATPQTGKTEFALKMLIDFAKKGYPCAFFSLELTKEQVYHRLFHIESDLSMQVLSNRVADPSTGKVKLQLSEPDAKQLTEAVKTIGKIPLFIYDLSDVGDNAVMIMQKIRYHLRSTGLFAYCIDFVQLCKTGIERIDNSASDTKCVAWVVDQLAKFNKKIKIFGCLISKLSRAVMTRGGSRRPMSSDLHGSNSLEYAADLILFMHRPLAYEDGKNWEKADGTRYNDFDVEFILTKNRVWGGKVGQWWQWQDVKEPIYTPLDFEKLRPTEWNDEDELPF